jgi:hypothetical protein
MASGASFAGTCLTHTAIFKNASGAWRKRQSDSCYQYFIFTATAQMGAADARARASLCYLGRSTNLSMYEHVILNGGTSKPIREKA